MAWGPAAKSNQLDMEHANSWSWVYSNTWQGELARIELAASRMEARGNGMEAEDNGGTIRMIITLRRYVSQIDSTLRSGAERWTPEPLRRLCL